MRGDPLNNLVRKELELGYVGAGEGGSVVSTKQRALRRMSFKNIK
jgi:hypothetical protein